MLQDPPALEPRTKGERTAQRILDVAENLFAQQGYEGTSLRQIAQGAALTEPALYNHFSGKQALYEAVLHRARSEERRVGKECRIGCRSRWSPYH